MRVHHYLKNLLIFLPIVFSQNMFNISMIRTSLIGFISFCVFSSVIYVINDINDVESDRKHPTKCKRPIASGDISIRKAYLCAGVLILIGIVTCYFSSKINKASVVVLLIYLLINIFYSKVCKNIPIIDIAILCCGFYLRVLYGSIVTGISTSNWMYLTVIAMSFYLGLGKRRNELRFQGNKTRKVLKYYNEGFLDKNMYMCLGLTIVFYSLWCVDKDTIFRIGNNNLVITIPVVILICMKYSLDIERDSDGDPISVLLGDRILSIMVICYLAITLSIIYLL